MKVLITGGAGFIGTNLCLKLKQLKWDIVVVDDYSSGFKNNQVPDLNYHESSILNKGAVDDLIDSFRFDVIFHLAAIPRVSYSVENPVKTAHANIIGTLNLLEAIRKYSPSTKFIYSSSSSVYGGADQLPTPENYPLDPQSPYALQKAQSEGWCKLYADLYGLNTISLRYFNVIGKYSRYGGPYTTVLGAWLYSLYVDTSVKPYLEGDGKQSRDFAYVDNVVHANIEAAVSERTFKGEALNIAHGEHHSLLECKELLEEISGEKLDLEMRPSRVGDVDHTLADISAAKELIYYKPIIDFEDQVREMATWYKDEYSCEVAAALLQ